MRGQGITFGEVTSPQTNTLKRLPKAIQTFFPCAYFDPELFYLASGLLRRYALRSDETGVAA
jgi:hypothetical protein